MAYSREIEKLERQFAENPRRFAAPFADALRKSEEVERALEVIQVGLELNPDYIPGSVILGRCHLDLGDDNGAEAAFSRVLDLDNENVIALKALADIMERQGRNDEAVRFLAYLLDVDRSNDEARDQLSRIQARPVGSAEPHSVAAPTAGLDPIFGAPPGEESPEAPTAVEEFLEPTALWDPPVNAAEASISSWVETTAAEPTAPPELGGSLLESHGAEEDVAPVEGIESMEFGSSGDPAAYEEFVLEREEEIVLTSLSGAEFQVANDSEDLLGPATTPASAEVPPEPVFESIASVEEPPAALPEAEAPAAEEAVSVVDVDVELPVPVAAPESAIAVELGATGSVAESMDQVDEEDEIDQRTVAEAIDSEAPGLVVTESMAELYAVQGHPGEALGVYRILYDRNPNNERLRQRIQELESAVAAQASADAAPSFAASVTGGKAVATFLGSMLLSRPAPVDIPEPPRALDMATAVSESENGSDEEAVASGAPTRPAIDRLSLGAIFGEDPSPVPPAENTPAGQKGDGAGGFSFDDFFGGGEATSTGRTSAGSVRATRAADDEDDLDQFHVWLQSLKR